MREEIVQLLNLDFKLYPILIPGKVIQLSDALRCNLEDKNLLAKSMCHFGEACRRWFNGRDRIVVSTSRCGRDNPGSNPGHGICL